MQGWGSNLSGTYICKDDAPQLREADENAGNSKGEEERKRTLREQQILRRARVGTTKTTKGARQRPHLLPCDVDVVVTIVVVDKHV